MGSRSSHMFWCLCECFAVAKTVSSMYIHLKCFKGTLKRYTAFLRATKIPFSGFPASVHFVHILNHGNYAKKLDNAYFYSDLICVNRPWIRKKTIKTSVFLNVKMNSKYLRSLQRFFVVFDGIKLIKICVATPTTIRFSM